MAATEESQKRVTTSTDDNNNEMDDVIQQMLITRIKSFILSDVLYKEEKEGSEPILYHNDIIFQQGFIALLPQLFKEVGTSVNIIEIWISIFDNLCNEIIKKHGVLDEDMFIQIKHGTYHKKGTMKQKTQMMTSFSDKCEVVFQKINAVNFIEQYILIEKITYDETVRLTEFLKSCRDSALKTQLLDFINKYRRSSNNLMSNHIVWTKSPLLKLKLDQSNDHGSSSSTSSSSSSEFIPSLDLTSTKSRCPVTSTTPRTPTMILHPTLSSSKSQHNTSRIPDEIVPICHFDTISEKDFAYELTRECAGYMKNITNRDIIASVCFQDNQQYSSYSVTQLTNMFNRITLWVPTEILSTSPEHITQTRKLKKFIDIAKILHELNNYHVLFAVLIGLDSVEIKRVKYLWENLDKKSKKTLNSLLELISVLQNYGNYRKKLRDMDKKTKLLQFFPIIKKDITFALECKLFISEKNDINMFTIFQISTILNDFISYRNNYDIPINNTVRHYLDKFPLPSDIEILNQSSKKLFPIGSNVADMIRSSGSKTIGTPRQEDPPTEPISLDPDMKIRVPELPDLRDRDREREGENLSSSSDSSIEYKPDQVSMQKKSDHRSGRRSSSKSKDSRRFKSPDPRSHKKNVKRHHGSYIEGKSSTSIRFRERADTIHVDTTKETPRKNHR